MIYVFIFCVVALLLLPNINSRSQYKTVKFLFFIVAIIAGLRYNIGADYLGYLSYYNKINFSNFYTIEPVFGLLISVFRALNFSYNSFLLGISFMTCGIFFLAAKELKISNPIIYLYLIMIQYFLGGLMGQIRQALAISILLLFFAKYIITEEKRSIILGAIIAGLIHFSGFVGLLIPLITGVKKSRTILLGFFTVLVITYLYPVSNLVISFFELFNIPLTEIIKVYSETEKYSGNYNPGIIAVLERFLVSSLSIFLILKSKTPWHKTVGVVYLLSVLITIGLRDFEILSQRLSRPLKFIEFFIYPIFYSDYLSNKKSKYLLTLFLLFLLLKPYTIIKSDTSKYLPYKSYLN